MKRIFGLDLMRTTAITFVLFGHGWFFLGVLPDSINLLSNAWVFGVEIFFVLSGFLIGGILIKEFEENYNWSTLARFWKRRWYRTLPNYFLFLLINFVCFSFLKAGFSWNWQYLFFLQNFAWMPDRFFSVSWSLAIEEWFYLLLPLSIIAIKFFTDSIKLAVVMSAVLFIVTSCVLRLYMAINYDYVWNEELRMTVIYRLDALMYGVFAAWLYHYNTETFLSIKKSVAYLGFFVFVISFVLRSTDLIYTNSFVTALLFPLSSFGFMCFLPVLATWNSGPKGCVTIMVTLLSTWSYSLYLVHVPVLEVVKILFAKFPMLTQSPINYVIFILWVLISLFISYLIYRYFEKPMMNLRDNKKNSNIE